jgi:hypothetical protein
VLETTADTGSGRSALGKRLPPGERLKRLRRTGRPTLSRSTTRKQRTTDKLVVAPNVDRKAAFEDGNGASKMAAGLRRWHVDGEAGSASANAIFEADAVTTNRTPITDSHRGTAKRLIRLSS